MLYPKGVMARGDPSLEKENLVLRAHKSEPGSGGLGSVRTRGLLTSEQRAQTVLKDSSLRNQVPLLCFTLRNAFAVKGFTYTVCEHDL